MTPVLAVAPHDAYLAINRHRGVDAGSIVPGLIVAGQWEMADMSPLLQWIPDMTVSFRDDDWGELPDLNTVVTPHLMRSLWVILLFTIRVGTSRCGQSCPVVWSFCLFITAVMIATDPPRAGRLINGVLLDVKPLRTFTGGRFDCGRAAGRKTASHFYWRVL